MSVQSQRTLPALRPPESVAPQTLQPNVGRMQGVQLTKHTLSALQDDSNSETDQLRMTCQRIQAFLRSKQQAIVSRSSLMEAMHGIAHFAQIAEHGSATSVDPQVILSQGQQSYETFAPLLPQAYYASASLNSCGAQAIALTKQFWDLVCKFIKQDGVEQLDAAVTAITNVILETEVGGVVTQGITGEHLEALLSAIPFHTGRPIIQQMPIRVILTALVYPSSSLAQLPVAALLEQLNSPNIEYSDRLLLAITLGMTSFYDGNAIELTASKQPDAMDPNELFLAHMYLLMELSKGFAADQICQMYAAKNFASVKAQITATIAAFLVSSLGPERKVPVCRMLEGQKELCDEVLRLISIYSVRAVDKDKVMRLCGAMAETMPSRALFIIEITAKWAANLQLSPYEVFSYTGGFKQLEKYIQVTQKQVEQADIYYLLVLIQANLKDMVSVKQRYNTAILCAITEKLMRAEYDAQQLAGVNHFILVLFETSFDDFQRFFNAAFPEIQRLIIAQLLQRFSNNVRSPQEKTVRFLLQYFDEPLNDHANPVLFDQVHKEIRQIIEGVDSSQSAQVRAVCLYLANAFPTGAIRSLSASFDSKFGDDSLKAKKLLSCFFSIDTDKKSKSWKALIERLRGPLSYFEVQNLLQDHLALFIENFDYLKKDVAEQVVRFALLQRNTSLLSTIMEGEGSSMLLQMELMRQVIETAEFSHTIIHDPVCVPAPISKEPLEIKIVGQKLNVSHNTLRLFATDGPGGAGVTCTYEKDSGNIVLTSQQGKQAISVCQNFLQQMLTLLIEQDELTIKVGEDEICNIENLSLSGHRCVLFPDNGFEVNLTRFDLNGTTMFQQGSNTTFAFEPNAVRHFVMRCADRGIVPSVNPYCFVAALTFGQFERYEAFWGLDFVNIFKQIGTQKYFLEQLDELGRYLNRSASCSVQLNAYLLIHHREIHFTHNIMSNPRMLQNTKVVKPLTTQLPWTEGDNDIPQSVLIAALLDNMPEWYQEHEFLKETVYLTDTVVNKSAGQLLRNKSMFFAKRDEKWNVFDQVPLYVQVLEPVLEAIDVSRDVIALYSALVVDKSTMLRKWKEKLFAQKRALVPEQRVLNRYQHIVDIFFILQQQNKQNSELEIDEVFEIYDLPTLSPHNICNILQIIPRFGQEQIQGWFDASRFYREFQTWHNFLIRQALQAESVDKLQSIGQQKPVYETKQDGQRAYKISSFVVNYLINNMNGNYQNKIVFVGVVPFLESGADIVSIHQLRDKARISTLLLNKLIVEHPRATPHGQQAIQEMLYRQCLLYERKKQKGENEAISLLMRHENTLVDALYYRLIQNDCEGAEILKVHVITRVLMERFLEQDLRTLALIRTKQNAKQTEALLLFVFLYCVLVNVDRSWFSATVVQKMETPDIESVLMQYPFLELLHMVVLAQDPRHKLLFTLENELVDGKKHQIVLQIQGQTFQKQVRKAHDFYQLLQPMTVSLPCDIVLNEKFYNLRPLGAELIESVGNMIGKMHSQDKELSPDNCMSQVHRGLQELRDAYAERKKQK